MFFGALFAYLIMKYGMAYYNDHGTVFGLVCESKAVAQNTNTCIFGCRCNYGHQPGQLLCLYIFALKNIKSEETVFPRSTIKPLFMQDQREKHLKRIIKTAIPIATGALVMSLARLLIRLLFKRIILHNCK